MLEAPSETNQRGLKSLPAKRIGRGEAQGDQASCVGGGVLTRRRHHYTTGMSRSGRESTTITQRHGMTDWYF